MAAVGGWVLERTDHLVVIVHAADGRLDGARRRQRRVGVGTSKSRPGGKAQGCDAFEMRPQFRLQMHI